MNVFSRRVDDTMTEMICGVEEAQPLLKWPTDRLGGTTTTRGIVFTSLVPTQALIEAAMNQAEMKTESTAA
jgi:hypothetical protein